MEVSNYPKSATGLEGVVQSESQCLVLVTNTSKNIEKNDKKLLF